MSSTGPYILCSNGDLATAGSMFLDPPYQSAAWERLFRRTAMSVGLFRSRGIVPRHAAYKYIHGQGLAPDGTPSPKFLDYLTLLVRNVAPAIANSIEPNNNVDAMRRFEDRVRLLGIEQILYYMGQAPTQEERDALSDSDWDTLIDMLNASDGEFIIDSWCYPAKYADTIGFLTELRSRGCRAVSDRFHGEAFPEGITGAPNVARLMCFGEDGAWHNLQQPPLFVCGVGLLHSGSVPPEGLPANQYRLNVRAALAAGHHVSIPIDAMPLEHLSEVFGDGGEGGEQA